MARIKLEPDSNGEDEFDNIFLRSTSPVPKRTRVHHPRSTPRVKVSTQPLNRTRRPPTATRGETGEQSEETIGSSSSTLSHSSSQPPHLPFEPSYDPPSPPRPQLSKPPKSRIARPPPSPQLSKMSISNFLSTLPLTSLHPLLYPILVKLGCTTPLDLLGLADQSILGSQTRAKFWQVVGREIDKEGEGGGLTGWQRVVLEEGLKAVWEDQERVRGPKGD